MGNQLARVEDAPSAQVTQLTAVRPTGLDITPAKKELLKRTICKGATDDELELALAICGRMKLDPFAKQIAFIKRWDSRERREVMTAQPTIDGARLLAQRSANYGGQLGPWWCGADGHWTEVWLGEDEPIAAKVGVINLAFKEPLFAVAKFSSYAARNKEGRLTATWAQMPDLMIAKCAEMLALRRAFPAEFSDFGGVDFGDAGDVGQMVTEAAQYIEIDGAVADVATGEIVQQDEVKTQPTQADAIKRLHAAAKERTLSHDDVHALAWVAYRVDSLTALDIPQLAKLTERVEQADMKLLQAAIAQWEAAHRPAADVAPEPTTVDDIPFDAPADETPDQEFAHRLRAATTKDEFERVSQQMTDGGIWSPQLAALQAQKRQELGLPGPHVAQVEKPAVTGARTMDAIVGDAPMVMSGDPGDDRFTN